MFSLILFPVIIAASIPSNSSSSIQSLNTVSCATDVDCRSYELDYCIDDKCYHKSDHEQQCDYDQQCYQRRETCTNGRCECKSNYKYVEKVKGCIPLEYTDCEYDSDCGSNYRCVTPEVGLSTDLQCIKRNDGPEESASTCDSALLIGSMMGAACGGVVLGAVIVVMRVGPKLKKEYIEASLVLGVQIANQSDQGSSMSTTQTDPN